LQSKTICLIFRILSKDVNNINGTFEMFSCDNITCRKYSCLNNMVCICLEKQTQTTSYALKCGWIRMKLSRRVNSVTRVAIRNYNLLGPFLLKRRKKTPDENSSSVFFLLRTKFDQIFNGCLTLLIYNYLIITQSHTIVTIVTFCP